MDAIERIEESIVAASEGLFDDPSTREDLHITIRIAKDFYDFLMVFGENPPADEVAYVSDTIRSGMDWFFNLAHDCGIITGSESWSFDSRTGCDFAALRKDFMGGFEDLANGAELKAVDGLAALLRLTHLQLVFVAQNFPSAILAPADPRFQADMVAFKAGQLGAGDLIGRYKARRDARRKAP